MIRRLITFYATLGKFALVFGAGWFGGCFFTGLGMGLGLIG